MVERSHRRDEPAIHRLAASLRSPRLRSAALVLPLAAFIAVTFVAPLVVMLGRSVYDPLVADALPETLRLLRAWDGEHPPRGGLRDHGARAAEGAPGPEPGPDCDTRQPRAGGAAQRPAEERAQAARGPAPRLLARGHDRHRPQMGPGRKPGMPSAARESASPCGTTSTPWIWTRSPAAASSGNRPTSASTCRC